MQFKPDLLTQSVLGQKTIDFFLNMYFFL